MGLRETYGGMIETAINAGIDQYLSPEAVKQLLKESVDKLVDEKYEELVMKLKANVVDKINGIDDIPDVK